MAKINNRLFLITILVLCIMTNTVNAKLLATTSNPSNILIGWREPSEPIGTSAYYLTPYFHDNIDKVSSPIPVSPNNEPVVMVWNSYIEFDTVYKYSIKLDFENVTQIPETGILNDLNSYFFFAPADDFTEIVTENVGKMQEAKAKAPGYYSPKYNDGTINNRSYHCFWDKTQQLLSVIFLIDENWAIENGIKQFNNYLGMVLGTTYNAAVSASQIELVSYTGLQVKGAYTDVLNEIAKKLETLAGGGGLTEEQINEAIQDALTAHDEQLEHEVDGKLDQILEQINGIVSPYKDAADEINNAFDGLTDVFASSSTASVFKFPEGRMPNGVLLWQEHNIDIGAAWNKLPAKFRSVVQIVCTFTILYIVIQEAVFVIRFIILGRKGSADD